VSSTGQVTAELVRDWVHHAVSGLSAARERIDALNVFPVPDGDTGTNLYFTVESAAESVETCCQGSPADGRPATGADAARAMAMGAFLGARGNSGVILSQILRGVGEVMAELNEGALDGAAVHRLLHRGSDLAYESVAHPVEGTILTVIREASDAAGRASESVRDGSSDALAVLEEAITAGEEALERTPSMLEALRLAGVVDAGGQGLLVVLHALAQAMSGAPRPEMTVHGGSGSAQMSEAVAHAVGPEYDGPAFEVMYLLDAEDGRVPELRAELDALGDSLVVVGGDGLWNVHVHVDDAGAAIEAALEIGRPHRIRVTHLQSVDRADVQIRGGQRRLVAVAHGPGIASLLSDAGVEVVHARAGVRSSVQEILEAIERASAGEVVVLPSDQDTASAAELAADQARDRGLRSAVIPTRSIVQTLAAVAVHVPDAHFDDDVIAMTRAAGATRYGAVTVASRAALTTVGPCAPGDVLGLVDGDIVVISAAVPDALQELLTGMLAIGGELVTVVFGADASASLRDDLVEWLTATFPFAEVVAVDGGQSLWPVIVGVE